MLPQRRSIRLPHFDYSQKGLYFVTICAFERQYLFGHIDDVANRDDFDRAHRDAPLRAMVLNEYGEMVNSIWQSLPNRFPVKLDAFQIMPNHVHMIVNIVGAIHESPDHIHESSGSIQELPGQKRRSLLPQIIGYFKMNAAKLIRQINPNIEIWQRNYYEHIIRNDWELFRIREYIEMNPQTWDHDENNLHQS